MKWKIEEHPSPKLGDRRTRRVFAWLPTVVKNYKVWLETYDVMEEFREVELFDHVLEEWYKEGKWVEIDREVLVLPL